MRIAQECFHPMRGHVEDGAQIVCNDGVVLTLQNCMAGWRLMLPDGSQYGEVVDSACAVARMVAEYPQSSALGGDRDASTSGEGVTASDSAKVPPGVLRQVRHALGTLQSVAEAVERGRDLDVRFGGAGRYVSDTLANRSSEVERAQDCLDRFKRVAALNGIDAESVIMDLGGLPELPAPAVAQQPGMGP